MIPRWIHPSFFVALSVIVLAVPFVGAASAQESHPFSVHDMLAMERIGAPVPSPDGKLVVFTLRSTDLEANRGLTDLWMVGIDGTGLRRLSSDPASDFDAAWAPNGDWLYFVSTRSGSSQVWRISMRGGEAQQVTDEPLDVGNLKISPDGTMLAYSMSVFIDCEDVECTVERLKEIEDQPYTGLTFDKLFIRHWDTWKDGRRSHLFVRGIEGGESVDVIQGMDADVPTIPWGGREEFNFTQDNRGIAFTARIAGTTEAWSTNFDCFVVPVDGSAEPSNLTADNLAWDTQPTFSPDGKTLAYLAMEREGYEADRLRIILRSWDAKTMTAGEAKALTQDFDRSLRDIVFDAKGRNIISYGDNLGQRALWKIDARNGKVTELLSDGTVRGPAWAKDRIVFGLDHLRSPVELYTIKPNGKDQTRITGINDAKLAKARMGEPEQFTFEGAHGDEVYAYMVKPADFDPDQKYPVAFMIHGGPQGSFGNDFHYRWNPQAYAGAGYAVVMVDFHASTGYGQAFSDAIRGDWGGAPLVDLQKGLAAALERYPWMDGEKVAALGASYGGYMVNWIAGNWSDRFTCLISHDGNLDERAAYFMTEELWFPEWDHMGQPWTNPEGYEKHNPVNFVQNWKTPMLIIHGALDYRVVDTSGIATFTACQRLGIPSRFIYFPDENHWVLQPQNSIQWHDEVIGWMDRWTK